MAHNALYGVRSSCVHECFGMMDDDMVRGHAFVSRETLDSKDKRQPREALATSPQRGVPSKHTKVRADRKKTQKEESES